MPSPETGIRDASPVRQPVLLGLFAGTAVGAGYLLAGIPNVELMTLITALAGSVLGAGRGFLCGALAACIYSLGSPYGLPVPLVLAAQAVGMGAAGLAGSWLGLTVMALASRRRRTSAILAAAGCGVLVAGVFDVLTNLAIVAAFSLPPLVVAGGAIPFFLIHAGSNAAIFGVFLPLMLPRLRGLGRPPLLARALAILALGGPLLAGGSPARAQVPAAQVPAAQVPAAQVPAAMDSAAQDSGVPLQGAAADTTSLPVPPAAPPPAGPLGWRRPLWDPFIPTALGWLSWHTPYLPVSDGGLGAVARILGDAWSSPVPLVLRDGVPLGTGHVLADDPALLPQVGLEVGGSTMGLDGWGGSGGLLELAATDPDPTAAMTGYWGSKGPHETYTRSVRWLTAQSTWRAAFDFEENLDLEGYNYTALPDEEFDPVVDENFPGHARIRLNRTRLTRNLSPLAGLAVQYDSGRKTKDGLPALGTAHQEIWQDGVAVALRDVRGRLGVQAVAYWRNGDVGWGDSPGDPGPQWRLLETGREGVHCDLFLQQDAPADAAVAAAPDTSGGTSGNTSGDTSQRAPKAGLSRLRLSFARWSLEDSGTAEPWAAEFTGPLSADGQQAYLAWRTGVRTGGLRATAEGAGRWSDALGWDPGGELRFEQDADRPVWGIYAQQGGRDPRSDESATPLRHVVDGRELVLLPEPALMREKTQAVGGDLACRLLGTELAVAVSLTRLEDGITWLASASDQAQGRWHNGLQLDAVRFRASVGREGRFLGWGRAALEGTWQKFDEISGRAAFLPPARTLRLRLLWENHFFQEDGILQLGLLSTRVGEMADPWDVTRAFGLPERTVHDLIVSFRLVGADLSLAFRNLTDERHQLTSGAASAGRELDLRLNWTFRH